MSSVDEVLSEAFRDLESDICDCLSMAEVAIEIAEPAIEGSDDKHERARFAVFHVVVMLRKLKADYYAAYQRHKQEEPA